MFLVLKFGRTEAENVGGIEESGEEACVCVGGGGGGGSELGWGRV